MLKACGVTHHEDIKRILHQDAGAFQINGQFGFCGCHVRKSDVDEAHNLLCDVIPLKISSIKQRYEPSTSPNNILTRPTRHT